MGWSASHLVNKQVLPEAVCPLYTKVYMNQWVVFKLLWPEYAHKCHDVYKVGVVKKLSFFRDGVHFHEKIEMAKLWDEMFNLGVGCDQILESQVSRVAQTHSEGNDWIPTVFCDREIVSSAKCLQAILLFLSVVFTFRAQRSCRESEMCSLFPTENTFLDNWC